MGVEPEHATSCNKCNIMQLIHDRSINQSRVYVKCLPFHVDLKHKT